MNLDPHQTLPKFPGVRALLIDDDAFVRGTVRRMLRVLGCTDISEVADGSEAMRLIVSGLGVDLIICDVEMAPMHGEAFLRRLRHLGDPTLAAISVLMLSAHTDYVTVRNAMRLGISGYLLKPLSTAQLATQLSAIFPAPAKAGAPPTLTS